MTNNINLEPFSDLWSSVFVFFFFYLAPNRDTEKLPRSGKNRGLGVDENLSPLNENPFQIKVL